MTRRTERTAALRAAWFQLLSLYGASMTIAQLVEQRRLGQ